MSLSGPRTLWAGIEPKSTFDLRWLFANTGHRDDAGTAGATITIGKCLDPRLVATNITLATHLNGTQDFMRSIDWLRVVRMLAQYIAPGLAALALVGNVAWIGPPSTTFDAVLLTVFSLLTVAMIAICGWTVFLWDIDRLFFRLENRIDAQLGEAPTRNGEAGDSLLGSVREQVGTAVSNVRTKSIALVEKSYWDDINAGGVLSFPQPDIAAAMEHIDRPRRDLLAPLAEYVATAIPLGSLSAPLLSRVILRFIAPEVKVRLYRRLVVRFVEQLGALFALTAVCFFISILAWSRVSDTIFTQGRVSTTSVLLYQLDLMLRGALFDFMEHTQRSVSPITINRSATAFVYYTLLFRMFVAVYVISSVFRVARFVFRRWRALLAR